MLVFAVSLQAECLTISESFFRKESSGILGRGKTAPGMSKGALGVQKGSWAFLGRPRRAHCHRKGPPRASRRSLRAYLGTLGTSLGTPGRSPKVVLVSHGESQDAQEEFHRNRNENGGSQKSKFPLQMAVETCFRRTR